MIRWLLVLGVVASTVVGDVLQSIEMKKVGEVEDFSASGLTRLARTLAQKKVLILAIFFMAISFACFMILVSVADLSFAVPATAASLVVETVLARILLKEHISPRRWMGAALVASGVVLLAF